LPVTVDQARDHVRADTDDDALTGFYVGSAVDFVQAYTGLSLLTQTVQLTRPDLRTIMRLPVGPVQSLTLQYLDQEGISQTVDPCLYFVTGLGTLATVIHLLRGKGWPFTLDHPAAVTATLTLGYGDTAAAVPAAILQSILLLVGDYYANREDTIAERSVTPATMPNGVAALLANYRI
jgi:uncharacterized phiE125 gp8 family phage protein